MSTEMERFTQRARRVLTLAQEAAERLQHEYIGPEHLLLALVQEEGGVAHRVLTDLGVESHRVAELIQSLPGNRKASGATNLELAPDTKRSLELAVDEARRMGHHDIGTEHLLLGLARQNKSAAIDVIRKLGISVEQIRRQLRRVLKENPAAPSGGVEAYPKPAPVSPTRSSMSNSKSRRASSQVNIVHQDKAIAVGEVRMQPETLALIRAGGLEKGDVYTAARLTGILAAKRATELLPYHHPSQFADSLEVKCELNDNLPGVIITAFATLTVTADLEMESLMAVSAAALTVWDMVRAVDRTVQVTSVKLVQ